ncbi:hypothetical protein GALL_173210 [mine drainage metagenome]|uniref:Outer membrane protein beta-barrel domain-containing protein n=1 Tax=mine drainage metagenome TaxID=410659 RepID=A0A1J5SKL2_9ZZZZ
MHQSFGCCSLLSKNNHMKKTVLLATFALLISFASKAQFDIGQKVISGGISLSNSNSTSTINSSQNGFTFGLNGSLGKFVSADHLVGFGISYNNFSQNQQFPPNSNKISSNQIGLNYYSTYYKTIAKNLYGFITWSAFGNYSFNSNNTTSNGVESVQKGTGFNLGFNVVPGISYRLNKRVLFNATLNNILSASFTSSKTTYSNSTQIDKGNGFNLSSSLSGGSLGNIGIGFSILLNKK